ncbi:MAG: hypothetical protein U1F87_18630 [Kiritimatiellia bacterium]
MSAGGDPLAGTHYLDTTTLPDGPHVLSAVGIEGTAVEAQGTASVTVTVDNHPGEVAITHPSAGSFVVEGQTVQVEVSAASPAGVAATNLLVRGPPRPVSR